ncbi:MAG TPA: HAD-IB family phosphatase [Candidatus Acidoferrum sp.]|nr:HAD-IB family phosphatase [Candidatus Acidoferrum sp.]
MSSRVAAFFDLDGTLLPLPPLEQKFFGMLRDRREIPSVNYFLWFAEALKMLPRGIRAVRHANKMYLRGVQSLEESGARKHGDSRAHASGPTGEGRPSMPPKHNPRWPVPQFFGDGVERVAWHARQGHFIVMVSGTLERLARAAARALEIELAARGVTAGIRVCATKLEEKNGIWTGRILGEAMYGKAKARAMLTLAEEMNLDLSQSWAYGDSAEDRWMLASVGNPAAVNPTPKLARIARRQGWPVLRTTNRVRPIENQLRHAERCA